MHATLFAIAFSLLIPTDDISGVVVDDEGNAVAGAVVIIVHPTDAEKDVATETDAEGTFKFAQIATSDSGTQFLVWKDGYAAGFHRLKQQERSFQIDLGTKHSDQIRIALQPQTMVRPVIVDPDGKPVGGAKVTPVYFGEGTDYVYRESGLPDVTATTSDDTGHVSLTGFAERGGGGGFNVDTEKFGRQRFGRDGKNPAPKKIVLSRTGALRGRIVSDDSRVTAGWQIDFRPTKQNPAQTNSETLTAVGVGGAVSVADGKFEIPHITIGTFHCDVSSKAIKKYSANVPTVEITVGKTTDIEIRLKPNRRAFGKILERNTSQPIAGVNLYVGGAQAESDKDGFFEGYVSQPPTHLTINSTPDGYVSQRFDNRVVEIKDPDASEFDLGTFTIKATTPITGVVTDEAGMPQSGVRVSASWVQINEGKTRSYRWADDAAVTDEAGRYRISNAPHDVPLLINAIGADLATKDLRKLAVDESRELNLTVSRKHTAFLLAAIHNAAGEPIPGVTAKINLGRETIEHRSMGSHSVRINGEETIASDESGIVRTPVRLPRSGKYSLTISADGYLPLTTDYQLLGGSEDEIRIGEFTLQRVRSASGTIRDAAGVPVSGVTVSAYGVPQGQRDEQPIVSVQTDASGRFSLSPLHPATTVVTVRGEGRRPTGAAIPSDNSDMSITVLKINEPIPDAQRVRIPTRRDDRIAAGRELLEKLMPELRGTNYFDAEALTLLSQVAPELVPDELAKTTNATARVKALIGLKEYEEANAQAEQISGGYSRAYARFGIIDGCDDLDLKMQMISAAMIDGKSVQEPDHRAVVLAGVAERLTAIGQHEQAHKLLMESLEQFRQLPSTEWAGFAKGVFAERLARYEFDAALALLEGMKDDDRARHVGNIAHSLAAIEPEKVEQLMADSDKTRSFITHRIRICYRMAPVDLERAERIRQGHPDYNRNFAKEHALGVMAMSLHGQDPEKAKQLLQQAWTELEATAESDRGNSQSGVYRFGVALALLNYTEMIDPDSLTDSFWRMIALYPGPRGNSWQPEKQQIEDIERQAMLVLAFGLYDHEPEMCRQIMQPAFEYWSQNEHLQDQSFYRQNATFSAMAIADPRQAAQWAVEAYKVMPAETRRLIPQPWLTIATTLCSEPGAVHDMLAKEVFHRWFIDNYDL